MTVAGLVTLGMVCALGLTVVILAMGVNESDAGGSLERAFKREIGWFPGTALGGCRGARDPASTAPVLTLASAPLMVVATFSDGIPVAPVMAAVAIGCGAGLATGFLVRPARTSRFEAETGARVSGLLAPHQ